MNVTIACDPRCKWGVMGDLRLCVWENYVLTCMGWHVAVNCQCLVCTTNVCVVLCRRVVVRSPRCLVTCAHSWCCRQVGWHCVLAVVCGCVSWAPHGEGFRLGRQAAWRPRCNRGGVIRTVDGSEKSKIAFRDVW